MFKTTFKGMAVAASLLVGTTLLAQSQLVKDLTSYKGDKPQPQAAKLSPTKEFVKKNALHAPKQKSGTIDAVKVSDLQTAAGVTFCGSMIYNEAWTEEDLSGMYTMTLPSTQWTAQKVGPRANGGGVYYKGKYYSIGYDTLFGIVVTNVMHVYDAETWEEVCEPYSVMDYEEGTYTIALDMTYNPVDGRVYGCFEKDHLDGAEVAIFNPETSRKTSICSLDEGFHYSAVACSAEGDLYGIGNDGNLYRISTVNGSSKLVGPTGITPHYTQSATFDFGTNQMYWFALSDVASEAGIYTVDLQSGHATKIANWTDGEKEITGVFTYTPNAPAASPAAPENLSVKFEDDAYEGALAFDMPTLTFRGQTLEGEVNYVVKVDKTPVASGTAMPGQHVDATVKATSGMHEFVVTLANKAGEGNSAAVKAYAGFNTPLSPAAATAVLADNSVSVSWQAVSEPVYADRAFDAANVRYNVTRQPDGVVVAKGIVETQTVDANQTSVLNNYYYEVTASNEDAVSAPTRSDCVVLGDAIEPPYTRNFEDGDGLGFFTVIDANNDGKTWMGNTTYVRYSYHSSNVADDWLVSPKLNLKKGMRYHFSSTLYVTPSAAQAEQVEFRLGNAPTVEGLSTIIVPKTDIVDGSGDEVAADVEVEEDGIYYIAAHCVSGANQFRLYIANFELSRPVALAAPVAVSNLTAVAGQKGELSSQITFTTPATSIDGKALTGISYAVVMNKTTGQEVARLEAPAMGQTCTVDDANAVQGINKYAVYCATQEGGEGAEANVEVYVGVDVPGVPTHVHFVQDSEDAVLTWDAPQVGANGGYINPDELTYSIYMMSPYQTLLTENARGGEYVHTDVPILEGHEQEIVYYAVFASNVAGTGRYASSNTAAFGTPFTTPFSESFANATAEYYPWIVNNENTRNDWNFAPMSTQGTTDAMNDGGMLVFKAYEAGKASITSPRISLAGTEHPVLKFLSYNPSTKAAVHVEVSADGEEWTRLCDVPASTTLNEWNSNTIDLAAFSEADYILVAFVGEANDASADILIDEVKVNDNLQYDLMLRDVIAPEKLDAGKPVDLSFKVMNNGADRVEAEAYTVNVLTDGKLIKTFEGVALDADASQAFALSIPTPLDAEAMKVAVQIAFDADMNQANNKEERVVAIKVSNAPAPTNLTGEVVAEGLKLTWDVPDLTYVPKPVTESFEERESWTIGGIDVEVDYDGATVKVNNDHGQIGPFSLIDNDHLGTYTFESITYPNQKAAMAGTVFDVNYPNNISNAMSAHSGQKMFGFWTAVGQNDDYLIFPELAENDKNISFWAKSYSDTYGLEKFEIVVSSTTPEISAFKVFVPQQECPMGDDAVEAGYTKYEYELPADAKYVAIHYVSNDVFILLVDDITYTPAQPEETYSLEGFNVYRNGVKINATLVTETSFVTENVSGDYQVSAVYKEAESGYSNCYAYAASGIVNALGNDFIKVGDGVIETSQPAVVWTVDHVERAACNAGKTRFEVEAGIYLVKLNGKVVKVWVR